MNNEERVKEILMDDESMSEGIARLASDNYDLMQKINRECTWKRDGDGCYYVRCRDIRVLMPRQRDADDNMDHNFMFCPYCGGRIHVSSNIAVSGGGGADVH